MSQKVENYELRGRRALSIEEVSETISKHPFLRPPQHVFILNGVIDVPHGTAVGYTPRGEKVIVLTPLSDQETVLHEMVHESTGLGELPTKMITRVLRVKERFTLLKSPASYSECGPVGGCQSTEQILRELHLQPAIGQAGVEHLVLLDRMFQISPRIPAELAHYILVP